MYRAGRLFALLIMLVLLASGAQAEDMSEQMLALLPANGVVEACTELGGMRFYTVSIPDTGEELVFSCDGQGNVSSIETQQEAEYDPLAAPVERERAEELVLAAYPGCRILFASQEGPLKKIAVAADGFCGTVAVDNEKICSRSLEMGEIYCDGMLTMDGALRIMGLHRPEARFCALELDEEDGAYVYEGEALLDGVEYEFELSCTSGKLLEWERD